jgi:hypothetical protein
LESPIAAIAKFCYFFLMTGEQIRRHFEATPFVPFRVHMASDKSANVPHPDFMHLSPTGRWLIVDRPDDTVEMIDLLLVTSLKTLPRNGSRARRRKKSRE